MLASINFALNTYTFLIVLATIIILSHMFNIVSRRTKIPAVLLLIGGGIGLQYALNYAGLNNSFNFFSVLEVLGVVGLIMIVLEAALDLTLERKKSGLILRSLGVAALGLFGSAFACAYIIIFFNPKLSLTLALYHATPLAILSSAIVIPSVSFLGEKKKEFHIYESTFSDILGIMLFYFLEGLLHPEVSQSSAAQGFILSFIATVVISLVAGYALIFIFQKITTHAKLFLLISILILLYSIGKLFHLSSLIIILIFGLMMSNERIFFKGFLTKLIDTSQLERVKDGFHIVTVESAFVVRTFFFVVFGLTIDIMSVVNLNVAITSIMIIISIYVIRWILLRIFSGKDLYPQVYIAPRGLITVLLFFAIPDAYKIVGFDDGIILSVIIATSVIMAISLMTHTESREGIDFSLEASASNEYKEIDLESFNEDIEYEQQSKDKQPPNEEEDIIEGGELTP